MLAFACQTSILSAQGINVESVDSTYRVNFNAIDIKSRVIASGKNKPILSELVMPNNLLEQIAFRDISNESFRNQEIVTIDGISSKTLSQVRFTITPSGTSGILHYNHGFYIFEETAANSGIFTVTNLNDAERGQCGASELGNEIRNLRDKTNLKNAAPFPIGNQLRKLRMAVAVPGEMTSAMGGKPQARDKVVQIFDAANLIFEVECALTFDLIPETVTSMSIIFANAATDPFNPNPSFASAFEAQNGFNVMNTNGILPYTNYDIGHVVSIFSGSGIRGQAGPSPCTDAIKARAWTEFSSPTTAVSSIVPLLVHEVGHQFSAGHSYNASAGGFCSSQHTIDSAVEPGGGCTIMGYANLCHSPVNYVLTPPNNQSYFHTKSLEEILTAVNALSCTTLTNLSNSPPVSNAHTNITIPIETPFQLNGTATDANPSDALSYAWDQVDVASANDEGAFGSLITGVGGYTAVNSTQSAPLFRSRISNSPERLFPSLPFILNDANNPQDNEGEDLPSVGRSMTFAFTVRDNSPIVGGIDSDQINVIVDGSKGPFLLSSYNSPATISGGNSYTLNWQVNNTNAISPNIKISLSVDGGNTFPFVLASSTANDGTHIISIPANIPATTTGRIKISSLHHPNHEFLDINNANITITSSCNATASIMCPANSVSAPQGDPSLNLSLNAVFGNTVGVDGIDIDFAGATSTSLVVHTDNTFTNCHVQWNPQAMIAKFTVTKTGNYNISNIINGGSGSTVTSVFNSSTFNCSTFLGSNGFQAVTWTSSPYIVNLTECTDYWAVIYDFNSGTGGKLYINGPGDVIEVENTPSGFSYTYVAVNNASGLILATSPSSNFTSLATGAYTVYGLGYVNTLNPSSLIGLTIAQAYNVGCLLFSSNDLQLTVEGPPPNCPPFFQLTGIELGPSADYETNGTIESDQIIGDSSNPGSSPNTSISVDYDSGIEILLKEGFETILGTTFHAFIDGCGNLFKSEKNTEVEKH